MTLEEKIEKERDKNDRLALEIERLKRRPYESTQSGDLAGLARRVRMKIHLAGELEELKRQKQESDERLAALKSEMQEAARADARLTQTTSESVSVHNKKAIGSPRRARKKYPKGFDGLQEKYVDMTGYFAHVELTQKQLQCFSLRKEYKLPLAEVAGRLGIDRKTAYEHIHEAEKKIQLDFEKRRDQSGRIKKAPITD